MFPFEWVGEACSNRESCYVVELEIDPVAIQPAISVQASWNKSKGIIRGCKAGGVLIEDHVREDLDDFGRLTDLGKEVFGSVKMRADVWTAKQHLAAYRQVHPEERVLAWVGNGNLLNNPHFVAFDGSSDSHVLYRLASEAQHLRTNGRSYSCLVVRKPGCGSRVSIENLCFDDGGGGPEVYSTGGECITREVEFATYGQMLVNNSRCITDDDLIRMIRNGEFYDLRHVFLFGRIETGPDRRIDIGLAGLWDEQGNIDADAVERALRGDRTFTDVRQFAPGRVRQAMLAKGYAEVADPKAPGEYSLKSGILMVVLKRGIYPHNMIGVRDDGRLIVAAVRGLSNRVGVTLPGGAEIMRMLGAKAALLIDNGGDVMMSFDDEMVLCSCEEQRDRLRSMILFRTMLPSCQLQWSALRLIKYPKHYANDQATSE